MKPSRSLHRECLQTKEELTLALYKFPELHRQLFDEEASYRRRGLQRSMGDEVEHRDISVVTYP